MDWFSRLRQYGFHTKTFIAGGANGSHPAPGCRVPDGKGGEISFVNEVQMVELTDGAMMLNSRKWWGKAVRKLAVSKDGGVTWSKIQEDAALRDPGCMASIFRYTSHSLRALHARLADGRFDRRKVIP